VCSHVSIVINVVVVVVNAILIVAAAVVGDAASTRSGAWESSDGRDSAVW